MTVAHVVISAMRHSGWLQDAYLSGRPMEGYPHYAVQNKPPGQSVIGSQPVSLDRENLELLRMKR